MLTSDGIKMKSMENWAKLNLLEFALSLPNVLLCEMIKDPRFAVFASYVPSSTKYAKPCPTNFYLIASTLRVILTFKEFLLRIKMLCKKLLSSFFLIKRKILRSLYPKSTFNRSSGLEVRPTVNWRSTLQNLAIISRYQDVVILPS